MSRVASYESINGEITGALGRIIIISIIIIYELTTYICKRQPEAPEKGVARLHFIQIGVKEENEGRKIYVHEKIVSVNVQK